MSKDKKLLEFEDIKKIAYVTAPAVSRDGKKVVFVKLYADDNTGEFIPHIYETDTEGKEAKRLINDEKSTEDRPWFSPDGTKLAYIGTASGDKQVWIINLSDNSTYQLTALRHGINNFSWSPDSKKIAFEAPLWSDEPEDIIFKEMTSTEKEEWEWDKKNMPAVIEELMYKFDETFGVADGSFRQIGIIDTETKSAKLLTTRTMHYDTHAWSNSGNSIACYGFPYGHNMAAKKEIFVINLISGEIKQLTNDKGYKDAIAPLFTKNDDCVIYSGLPDGAEVFLTKPIKISISDGTVDVISPDEKLCHGIAPSSCGKAVFGKCNPEMQLSECGKYLYFISVWQGYTHIFKMDLDGLPVTEKITRDNISVRTFCRPINNKLVYTRGDLSAIDDVYCLDLTTGVEKRLTYSNEWLNDVYISVGEEMWVDSKDKTAKIHGWFIPPAKVEEGKKYPVVLDIHGGPEICYTAGWWHEFQMLSANGIGVVYCDPRGSSGFGTHHMDDSFAWGEAAYDDLLTFLEYAENTHTYIDSGREGVTGGSYGGYMTNKFIGSTKRFKAAVTQRTFCNQATSYGTGDMGFISTIGEGRPKFYDYMINRAKKSMINKVDNIKTPLLILHGTADYRCSYEQGEQMFVAMKERNPEIPVRMIAFLGENHGITRIGKIHAQITHLKEMTAWFIKYLSENGGNCDE